MSLTESLLGTIDETKEKSVNSKIKNNQAIIKPASISVVYPSKKDILYLGNSSFVHLKATIDIESSLIKSNGVYLKSAYESAISFYNNEFDKLFAFDFSDSAAEKDLTLYFYQERLRSILNFFFIKKYEDSRFYRNNETGEKLDCVPYVDISYLKFSEDNYVIEPIRYEKTQKSFSSKLEIESALKTNDYEKEIGSYSSTLVNFKYIPEEIIGHICYKIDDFLKNNTDGQKISEFEYLTHDKLNIKDLYEIYKYSILDDDSNEDIVSFVDSFQFGSLTGKLAAFSAVLNFIFPSSSSNIFPVLGAPSAGFFSLYKENIICKTPELTRRKQSQDETDDFSFYEDQTVLFLKSSFSNLTSSTAPLIKVFDYASDENPFLNYQNINVFNLDDKNEYSSILTADSSVLFKGNKNLGILNREIDGSRIILSLDSSFIFPLISLPIDSYNDSIKRGTKSLIYDRENPGSESNLSDIEKIRRFSSYSNLRNSYSFENGEFFSAKNSTSRSYSPKEESEYLFSSQIDPDKGISGNYFFNETISYDQHVIDLSNSNNLIAGSRSAPY